MVELIFFAIPTLIAAVFFPPFAVALSLLFSISESYGIGNFLSQFVPFVNRFLSASVALGGIVSLFRLWRERNPYPVRFRLRLICSLAIGIIMWIILSMLWNEKGIMAFYDFLYVNVFGMIVAFAYRNNHRAKILFVVILAVHLLIGTAITLWPGGPLKVLEGSTYISYADVQNLDIYRKYSGGQFINRIQLAFYGSIGLIVGIYLSLSSRSKKLRYVGIGLVLMSVWTLYSTEIRGILLGLAFGFFVVFSRIKGLSQKVLLICFIGVILWGGISLINKMSLSESSLLYRLRNIPEDEFTRDAYRIKAIIRSGDVIISHPIMGLGDFKVVMFEMKYLPHQAPLYYAVMYGVPAGFFVLMLLWFGIAANFKTRIAYVKRFDRNMLKRTIKLGIYKDLLTMFGWVTFFLAMTNGMAGGMLTWIVLGIASLQWVYDISPPGLPPDLPHPVKIFKSN